MQVVASCVVVASSSLQPAKQSFRSTMSLSSPVMSSIPSPQPCSPCHSRHWWQLPCGVTMHAKLLRVLGPRPRQRMRRAGWQSDSDSVATSRDRGPACDRSEGRSEEDWFFGRQGEDRSEDRSEDRRRIGVRIGVSPALSCPPRARLVVAAPSSPCCRARVIDADVVIASSWPQSSPCPRRRRAVVPAPSSHPLRLWGACPPNMQSRPFWGVWIAISQGVGQDARRVIQTFA